MCIGLRLGGEADAKLTGMGLARQRGESLGMKAGEVNVLTEGVQPREKQNLLAAHAGARAGAGAKVAGQPERGGECEWSECRQMKLADGCVSASQK